MGTRSNIGIVKENGSIETIYCHWDGYPEWVGVQLALNYKDVETVKELISYGDRSSLNATPDFKDAYVYTQNAKIQTGKYASFEEYDKAPKSGIEFVYLYQNGTWFIYETADDDTLVYKGVISNIKVEFDTSASLDTKVPELINQP